jgi:Protein of unknown function (DUF3551)
MRVIAVLVIMCPLLSALSHEAHADGTWCARYPEGASNCGFYSFAQCQATVSGRGGFCEQNAMAAPRQRRR